jgi:drug/metabolite transporter (DMT)-like permease
MHAYFGEFTSFLVAIFWAVSAIAFESAGKRIGSLSVNIVRLVVAMLFLSIYSWIVRGLPFPSDASVYNWIWLSFSGLVGFVLGDLFLFKAFTVIGSRLSLLIMNLAPPIAAFAGWLFLGENISFYALLGIIVTFSGISLVVFGHNSEQEKFRLNVPIKGLLFALGGAFGQAFGLILSKKGMDGYDAFAATQIRIITGIVGFLVIIIVMGRLKRTMDALSNKQAMMESSVGAFFGPFLGVGFSLLSLKYTATGIAATIMATTPIILIIPSVLIFKQRVKVKEIIGAILSIVGLTLFFVK